MLISKKMSVKDFCGYIVAQFLGAIAGAAALNFIVKDTGKLGCNALYNGSAWMSFGIEVILTFVFVIAILGVTSKESNGNIAGLVIGGALVLVHLLGINFTGTSVNPARSFGPALIAGNLDGIWVFLLAPLVGGALAAVVYSFLSSDK
jgi:aquaporin Z